MQNTIRPDTFNLTFFNKQLARKNFNKYMKQVVGYSRLSFDEDGSGYCSIINQNEILEAEYHKNFEDQFSTFTIIEDDNVSGYKFDRPGLYQLLKLIEDGKCNIILAKDLSRIGRHGALTQLFIEQCQHVGIRIVALGDYDSRIESDDMILGIRAWSNERVVKDASQKINKVIQFKQSEGTWFCGAPFGYIPDYQKKTVRIDESSVETLYLIARLFIEEDYGINKIAKELTFSGVPTPSMVERDRFIAEGREYKRKVATSWSASVIATILDNDFYNGVFRTGKYEREGINGKDIRVDPNEHKVFKDHHPKIYDDDIFAKIQEKRKSRKIENFRSSNGETSIYHGKVYCGDCGSVMYRYRKNDITDQYVCSQYFKYGKRRCTRHMIKVQTLDHITLAIIKYFRDMCPTLINSINSEVIAKGRRASAPKVDIQKLQKEIDVLRNEIEVIESQRIKQIMTHPEREDSLNAIYDKMHQKNIESIEHLQTTIEALKDQDKNLAAAAKRLKTAKDILDEIINAGTITRIDIEAIYEKIIIYENGNIDVHLISDLNALEIPQREVVDRSQNQLDRVYNYKSINEVNDGDPLLTSFILMWKISCGLHAVSQMMNKYRIQ